MVALVFRRLLRVVLSGVAAAAAVLIQGLQLTAAELVAEPTQQSILAVAAEVEGTLLMVAVAGQG